MTILATRAMAPGKVEIAETAVPHLQPNHALIRPQHISLCGSDLYMLHHQPAAAYPTLPGVSGHEIVGTIEAINAPDSPITVGDKVLVLMPLLNGMSQLITAPVKDILPLPGDAPVTHLLQAQQLGTVIHACKYLPTNPIGKDVIIIGQGSAGLWFNWILRRLGAKNIIGIDLLPHRLAVSEQFGATAVILNGGDGLETAVREQLNGRLAHLVIEAAGEASSINLAHKLVQQHGGLLYFGIYHGQRLDFDYFAFFEKFCRTQTISGTWTEPNHASTRQAIDFIAQGNVDVTPMLTHRFPFTDVLHAYALQQSREDGAIKIVVDF